MYVVGLSVIYSPAGQEIIALRYATRKGTLRLTPLRSVTLDFAAACAISDCPLGKNAIRPKAKRGIGSLYQARASGAARWPQGCVVV